MPQKLNPSALQTAITQLPGWSLENGELTRTFQFKDFLEAIAFVNRVAEEAEAAAHHPDIDIRYNKVRLTLITHDAGGITTADIDMAKTVNGLL